MKAYIFHYYSKSSRNYVDIKDFPSEYFMFLELRSHLRLSRANFIRIIKDSPSIQDNVPNWIFRRDNDRNMVLELYIGSEYLYSIPF